MPTFSKYTVAGFASNFYHSVLEQPRNWNRFKSLTANITPVLQTVGMTTKKLENAEPHSQTLTHLLEGNLNCAQKLCKKTA